MRFTHCSYFIHPNKSHSNPLTLLRYGQTASGKTFTMGSSSDGIVDAHEVGVIPRAMDAVFHKVEHNCGEGEFYFRVQFLELYGDTLRDLLDPVGTAQGKVISIREGDKDTEGIHITGAREETVTSKAEMSRCLEKGTLCRMTGSTDMNARSSRSHAIFSIILEQHLQQGEEEVEYRTSKFHFVDLAGSERAKRTKASGQRLKEGIEINKGLLSLGNVISQLGEGKKAYVSYRDSKLTRLLQDSLGGNSKTLMITCVSPAHVNQEESLNALRYANRARNIENQAIINRDPASSQIAMLKAQVAMLKERLLGKGGDPGEGVHVRREGPTGEEQTNYMEVVEYNNHNHLEEISRLEQKLETADSEVMRLNGVLSREKAARSESQEQLVLMKAELAVVQASSSMEEVDQGHVEEHAKYLREITHLNTQLRESDAALVDFRAKVQVSKEATSTTLNEMMTLDPVPDDILAQLDVSSVLGELDDDEEVDGIKHKFVQSQQALKKMVSSYDVTLRSKQIVMQQIMAERQRYETMKGHYESQMLAMNQEVKVTQQQCSELETKLAKMITSQDDSSKVDQLRRVLQEKNLRLKELEKKSRTLMDAQRTAMQWRRKEGDIRREIEEAKRQKVEYQRKMADNIKAFRAQVSEHRHQIRQLQKQGQTLKTTNSKLTSRVDRDASLLKRKTEQVTGMQRKLREAQKMTAHNRKLTQRERRQRAQLEKFAEDRVKKEEELKELRTALDKKEAAMHRRVRLCGELEALKSEAEKKAQVAMERLGEMRENMQGRSENDGGENEGGDAKKESITQSKLTQAIQELEQRLEATDSEIVFRDQQCFAYLEDNEEVEDTLLLPFEVKSVEEASEVCKVLIQMYIEAKQREAVHPERKTRRRLNEGKGLSEGLENKSSRLNEGQASRIPSVKSIAKAVADISSDLNDTMEVEEGKGPSTPKGDPPRTPPSSLKRRKKDFGSHKQRLTDLESQLKSLQATPKKGERGETRERGETGEDQEREHTNGGDLESMFNPKGWQRVAAQTTQSYQNKLNLEKNKRQHKVQVESDVDLQKHKQREQAWGVPLKPLENRMEVEEGGVLVKHEGTKQVDARPIHERLNDPKYYTGTQKRRLALERARRKQAK